MGWLHRKLRLGEDGLLLIYRGFLFYGLGRMLSWFLYARFLRRDPFQPRWGGPDLVPGTDLSDAAWPEVLARTAAGGALFAGFVYVCWWLFVARLWERGDDPPIVERGRGLRAVFEH